MLCAATGVQYPSKEQAMTENEPAAASDLTASETSANDSCAAKPPPLRSVHTSTFAQILDRLGVSLAVTTYQAGKLVLLRPERRDDGMVINTDRKSVV